MKFSTIMGSVLDRIVPYRRRLRDIEEQISINQSELLIAIQNVTKAHNEYVLKTDEALRKHGEGIAEVDRKGNYTSGHLTAMGTQFVRQLNRIEKKLGLEKLMPDPDLQLVKKGERAPPRAPRPVRKPGQP